MTTAEDLTSKCRSIMANELKQVRCELIKDDIEFIEMRRSSLPGPVPTDALVLATQCLGVCACDDYDPCDPYDLCLNAVLLCAAEGYWLLASGNFRIGLGPGLSEVYQTSVIVDTFVRANCKHTFLRTVWGRAAVYRAYCDLTDPCGMLNLVLQSAYARYTHRPRTIFCGDVDSRHFLGLLAVSTACQAFRPCRKLGKVAAQWLQRGLQWVLENGSQEDMVGWLKTLSTLRGENYAINRALEETAHAPMLLMDDRCMDMWLACERFPFSACFDCWDFWTLWSVDPAEVFSAAVRSLQGEPEKVICARISFVVWAMIEWFRTLSMARPTCCGLVAGNVVCVAHDLVSASVAVNVLVDLLDSTPSATLQLLGFGGIRGGHIDRLFEDFQNVARVIHGIDVTEFRHGSEEHRVLQRLAKACLEAGARTITREFVELARFGPMSQQREYAARVAMYYPPDTYAIVEYRHHMRRWSLLRETWVFAVVMKSRRN